MFSPMYESDPVALRRALFEDAIKYAEEGFPANKHLLTSIQKAILNEPKDSKAHSFRNKQDEPWFEGLR